MVQARKIEKFNDFQIEFLKWAINKKTMLLQGAAGAGKTLSVMGLYLHLRQRISGGKLFVVTARKAAEAFKKANVKNLLVFTLYTKQDLANFYSGCDFPADIYIISNTLLTSMVSSGTDVQKRALTELLKRTVVLCLDEVHAYRSYDSARHRAVKKVTDFYHRLIDRDSKNYKLVGITATPIFKNLENLHPLFNLICKVNPLGTWKYFVDRYCVVESIQAYGSRRVYSSNGSHSYKDNVTFDKIVGYKNVSELYGLVSPYIFVWEETSFNFKFGLHYYSLLPDEVERYRESIRGLGLDKTYAIDLKVGNDRVWVYRNKSDTFYLPNRREVQTGTLDAGMDLVYNGLPSVVCGVYDKKIDAGFAVRAVKAQQCNSKARNKLALIADLIRSEDIGVLVYFNFLESVDAMYDYLRSQFRGRNIVKLTGNTKRFSTVVASIGINDIVLMSSVASQSLDMYIPRLIIAENFGLTPGKIEQLCGRMTRENAEYRDVSVSFVLRDGENVESYFYEKLRHRLRTSKSNVYVKEDSLPASRAVSKIPDHLIDEAWLKKRLLWSGA